MDKSFFPRNKQFWLINLSCWAAVYALLLVGNVLSGKGLPGQALGASFYVCFGVLGGLLFRKLFYLLAWVNKPISKLAVYIFLFVLLEGIVVGLLVSLYVHLLSLFLPEWLGPAPAPPQLSHRNFLLFVFFVNAINIALFQALWSAIYVAVVTYRKSIRKEMDALKLANALKEAQLTTLSSQLNPHFLFNALNNIRFMMRKDVANAEDMLTHLSDLLRYALESSKAEKVSIDKELEIVDHYISLVQIQFSERLNFNKEIKLDSTRFLIPPMVLQMLIENAVKHGAEELKEGGDLKLNLAVKGDTIEIRVCNDFARYGDVSEKSGFGIGLSNIQQRIDLLYGDKAQLTTKTIESSFTVNLTIPQELA